MRLLFAALVASLLLLPASQGSSRDGHRERGRPARPPSRCWSSSTPIAPTASVFRRDVLPRYREAVRANAAPLRFVDIEKGDTASLALKARIDTVPTAVVMRNGREVDRIVGYWGPNNFFKLLAHILGEDGIGKGK